MDNDKAPEDKQVSARPNRRRKAREKLPTLAELAAEFTPKKLCRDRWSKIGKAQRRVQAYDLYAARLLRRVASLPRGHPKMLAALDKIVAIRPRYMQASDDLLHLQFGYALFLQETSTTDLPRA